MPALSWEQDKNARFFADLKGFWKVFDSIAAGPW
jgi:hypothetical protein